MNGNRPFDSGPAGAGGRTAAQGDCMESIAAESNFRWQKLWDLPENKDLKDARGTHNILLPGDRIHVPEPTLKWVEVPTGRTQHVFRRKGGKTKIVLKMQKHGEPRKGEPFVLKVAPVELKGTTKDDGTIEAEVPVLAKKGTLEIGDANAKEVYELLLGHLDPQNEISGVKGRLNNLGYDCGSPDSRVSPDAHYPIQVFQASRDIEPTGKPEEDTRNALVTAHEN